MYDGLKPGLQTAIGTALTGIGVDVSFPEPVYEADHVLARLWRTKKIDVIVSNDTDFVPQAVLLSRLGE